MSDWEVDGVADNAWPSLDEVAWMESESKGDTIAAEPGVLRGSSCTALDEPCQRGAGGGSSQHRHQQTPRPSTACLKTETFDELTTQNSGYSRQERVASPPRDRRHDSTPGSSISVLLSSVVDQQASVSDAKTEKEISNYSFEGAEMCKGEYCYEEDGADHMVNSSCHFLLSDGGDLEFLAEVQEEARRDNLLEFGWGNTNQLEDIDKLFSSSDSIYSHGFENSPGTLLWEPPSPTLGDSLASLQQPVDMPMSPEFVSQGIARGFEAKVDTGKDLSKPQTGSAGGEWGCPSHDRQSIASNLDNSCDAILENSCSPMQVYADCRNGNNLEGQGSSEGRSRDAECMENDGYHVLMESNKASKVMQFGSPQNNHDSTQALKESDKWKTVKGRRHGPRSKRTEDTFRKPSTSQRRVALNLSPANTSPFVYMPVVPIAQDSPPPHLSACAPQVPGVSLCEPISPMQCLQPVPYVHAGFGFPTRHHPPVAQQLQPQGPPVLISYQPPFIDVAKVQQSNGKSDVPSQSPTASSTMTPQEKIEKLRWRQKMQARLAVDQQQQQLINQRLIPEQAQFGGGPINLQLLNTHEEVLGGSVRLTHAHGAEPLHWNERSLFVEGTVHEDGDESLAATVLHQLLNMASKMDTRTRLCLRDGFRRLARNAMQRRASGDVRGSSGDTRGSKRNSSELMHRSCTAESSSSSDQSRSQRLLTVDDIVETETNPMDRFIAHLLFHKRFPSSYAPANTPRNNSEMSEPGRMPQSGGWACWSEDKQLSHLSPATRSSSVTAAERVGATPTSDSRCENTSIRAACPLRSQPRVSGLQLLNFSTLPAEKSMQPVEESETGMAELVVDPGNACRATSKADMSVES